MGKTGGKMPSFCLNRIRPHVRVPPIQSTRPDSVSGKTGSNNKCDDDNNKQPATGTGTGRKIMIVVDSSFEAEGALQWALSNTVQNQDNILLLHLTKPSKTGERPSKETAPRAYQVVDSMRNLCQLKRPEVEIEVRVVEGKEKEKGAVIVEEARKQGASVLVMGQRKRSTTWRLLMVWAGHRFSRGSGGGSEVEYCIQNASCMAIAVRRKSKKLGGYLITTKRQKDFWLLA